VLEGSWKILEEDMNKASNFDSLIRAHSRYMATVTDRTLLSERSRLVLAALNAMLETVLDFRATQIRLVEALYMLQAARRGKSSKVLVQLNLGNFISEFQKIRALHKSHVCLVVKIKSARRGGCDFVALKGSFGKNKHLGFTGNFELFQEGHQIALTVLFEFQGDLTAINRLLQLGHQTGILAFAIGNGPFLKRHHVGGTLKIIIGLQGVSPKKKEGTQQSKYTPTRAAWVTWHPPDGGPDYFPRHDDTIQSKTTPTFQTIFALMKAFLGV
ncbi:MAG: Spc97/Spc98 family protein, partial [Flavobacteriales bacterium]|nr:Spc97/Spc98 family protein [Flavobacteriales bacterium]